MPKHTSNHIWKVLVNLKLDFTAITMGLQLFPTGCLWVQKLQKLHWADVLCGTIIMMICIADDRY